MRLYKYQGIDNINRDLDFVKSNKFWASKIQDLNDPSEALYNIDSFKRNLTTTLRVLSFFKLVDLNNKNAENLSDAYLNIINLFKKYGIYCLSKDILSELMWAHYSSGHKGFCIEYEIENVKEFDIKYKDGEEYLENSISKIDIHYSNKIFKIEPKIINANHKTLKENLFERKSKSWKYEREVRIITMLPGEHNYSAKSLKSITLGLRMSSPN